jgi:hypothetical protein
MRFMRPNNWPGAMGWTFGWKLIEVPGVGHDAAATSGSPQAVEAPGLGTGG